MKKLKKDWLIRLKGCIIRMEDGQGWEIHLSMLKCSGFLIENSNLNPKGYIKYCFKLLIKFFKLIQCKQPDDSQFL